MSLPASGRGPHLQPPERADRPPAGRAQRPERSDLVDQLPAILYVAEAGDEGRWSYVSYGVTAILGFAQQDWLADPGMWARQLHPEDRERVLNREAMRLDPGVPEEYRVLHRDGTVVWMRDEAVLVVDEEGREHWHGVILDITDRKLAEAELERSAEQQAAVARLGKYALQGAEVGNLIRQALDAAVSVTGARSGAILEQDGQTGLLVARAAADPGGTPGLAGQSSLRCEELPAGVLGQIETRRGRWGVLWLGSCADHPLGLADSDFAQAVANILADAIERRASEDDIRYQASHDPLTGLPNRALFLERLGSALERNSAEVAVVLLDIDNFKLINDSLGHVAGDELLVQIAPRLSGALRPADTIARLGGDEFVVLLEHIPDEHSAAALAQRMVDAFEAPFELNAGEHFAKASFGIAIAKQGGSTAASLIRDADAALYQAKARGRARFEVFDRAMRERTYERLTIENDLRRALGRGELHLLYQPIVSLHDRSIRSVEALLRWHHPERGLMSPAEFIPVAEESGMIEPIGRWVLERACEQAARWQKHHRAGQPLGVSVNLSVRQFMEHDLAATVAAALTASGLDPSSLCLEITESVLLKQAGGVSETIRRVARLGVRFALDDFGTGYSSLAYLGELPIDALKVDRSFVERLGEDERSMAITRAIVRMAQALSIEVIAEGVEEATQVEVLRELGCVLAQGFQFHRPLPVATVTGLLGAAGCEDTAELRPLPHPVIAGTTLSLS